MADLLSSQSLPVPHGFSTRAGASAADVIPGAALVIAKQVHSAHVLRVEEPWPEDRAPQADALVTDRPGLVLGVVTADCAPVLLADDEARVVGAAHAGWRGAHGGIVANTVAAMEELGARPERIVAAIGPCIARASYEVDETFRKKFGEGDDRFFVDGRAGHFQFDLAGYVAARLRDAGVGHVDMLARDTYAEEESFCSYRRATHRGEPTGGRQISLIGLRQSA
ncbi:peptidoglycan editing factor PgeF [Qipengyuania sp. MTN3-11]|uniref:peptidoglycan editing factor PgeF n=1 Tax=Qipengyuania sp. MTN3-11 TaxID=3056557 RepID=UPI0036F2B92A